MLEWAMIALAAGAVFSLRRKSIVAIVKKIREIIYSWDNLNLEHNLAVSITLPRQHTGIRAWWQLI